MVISHHILRGLAAVALVVLVGTVVVVFIALPAPQEPACATVTASAQTAAPTASLPVSAIAPSGFAPTSDLVGAEVTRLPPGSGPPGIPGTWKLVFDDEFNASSLDTTMWTANWLAGPRCITPPVNPCCEQAAYDPAQVIEANGVLSLTAAYDPVTVNGTAYAYRSGMIQSDGKFQFAYGVIEAHICLPGTNAKIDNWPAFWTDGHSWPSDGEMDVMEGLSGNAANHFHSSSGTSGAQVPGDHTGCHSYAADWESGVVSFYIDGAHVRTLSSGITSSPMYIVLNYAISSEYGGPLVVPATMQVDYVHVWQHSK